MHALRLRRGGGNPRAKKATRPKRLPGSPCLEQVNPGSSADEAPDTHWSNNLLKQKT